MGKKRNVCFQLLQCHIARALWLFYFYYLSSNIVLTLHARLLIFR